MTAIQAKPLTDNDMEVMRILHNAFRRDGARLARTAERFGTRDEETHDALLLGWQRPAGGEAERPLIERLTLHAEKLRFDDPAGGAAELAAPLPKDFRAALNMLRKYAR